MRKLLEEGSPLVQKWLVASPRDHRIDYKSKDGKWGIAIADRLRGARDLAGHVLNLARWVAETQHGRSGCLILLNPQMSQSRLEKEWGKIKTVLRKDIGRHIVIHDARSKAPLQGAPPWLKNLLNRLGELRNQRVHGEEEPQSALSRKSFEVFKALLNRYLRRKGPIGVLKLARLTGGSYPTIKRALERFAAYAELTRGNDRSVSFERFPHRTWTEVLALLSTLRKPIRFKDTSGRSPNALGLLARIERLLPTGVAVGGVVAARKWDLRFNLHGTPRLDLMLHAPKGRYSLDFVSKIDPALKRCSAREAHAQEAVLVIHPLFRAETMFEEKSSRGLPLADVVETVLDLHELRLMEQAEGMIHRWRATAGDA